MIPLIIGLFHLLGALTSIRAILNVRTARRVGSVAEHVSMLFAEPSMVGKVEKMFEADFARSTRATAADYTARPWWFRLAARTCRLMAPVQ
jgi:hypothetical protein